MTSNMEDDDLDLLNEGTAGAASQSVRKTINLKLRPESKGRGRGRKATKNVKKIKQESPPTDDEEEMEEERERERERDRERKRERERESALLNHENIQLSPVKDREPWTPIQTISWNNKVNLIGEKVVDPMIHSCDTCTLPILIYGRMIPCKHVFCFNCAKKTEKNCPRCEESVQRIEQSALGTVYICSFGGSRHTPKGCKRTYLSARDLQAHIGHRHLKAVEAKAKKAGSGQIPGAATSASLTASTGNPFKITIPDLGTQTKISIGVSAAAHSQPVQSKAPLQQPQVSMARPEQTYQTPTQEVYVHHAPPPQPQMVPHPQPVPPPASLSHSQPPPDSFRGSSIPVLSSRTNLISIPIQGVQHQQHQEYKPQQMQYPQVSFPQSRPPGPAQIPVSQPFPSHSHAPPMRQAPPQSFHAPMSHAGNPISYATAPMSMPGPIMVPSQMPPRPSAVVLSSGPGGPPMHPPPMNVPPPHIGPPPGHPQGMPPPQRYPSPHRQYEETPMSPSYNQPGGHSPRPPWPGSGPPRGPPGGPPGPVPPRPNVSAPPPLRPPDNFQYFH